MKNYQYAWQIRLSDWHILNGGIRAVLGPKLHALAKEEGVTVDNLWIDTAGVKFSANKSPDDIVRAAAQHLQNAHVSLRIGREILVPASETSLRPA